MEDYGDRIFGGRNLSTRYDVEYRDFLVQKRNFVNQTEDMGESFTIHIYCGIIHLL